ncbi:MAG: phosphate ABC transporter permease subunit PstC [Dehalococcoidia bacterium]|nr:phosphate ABC transporter permease subunit PstC [Dehalococcoidia bacterium]
MTTGPDILGASPARRGNLLHGRWRRLREAAIGGVLFLCALLSVGATAAIIITLLEETVGFFREVSFVEFVTDTQWTPQFKPQHFGILPLLSGTLLIAAGGALIALPVGLLTAVFLSEYAPSWLRSIVKPVLEVLAGIPTVVFGFFALTFVSQEVVQRLFPGTQIFNAASAAAVVGIMIIPLVSSLSEDAMSAVPRSLREGAYALGSSRFEVSMRVVVPAALSGIVASFILAVSRAVGETMIVALAAGATPNLTWNPLESVQTMTAYIVQVSLGDTPQGSLEFRTIFAVAMALFVMTLTMNIVSQYLLQRFREVYE